VPAGEQHTFAPLLLTLFLAPPPVGMSPTSAPTFRFRISIERWPTAALIW